jgi:isoleucyl-tRNA synthetase
LAEVYRKVRNTIRFILGNLNGFDASRDRVPYSELSRLDQYILHRLQEIVQTLTEAFDTYEFHKYYQVLQNFCVTELSSLYFDVTKDILYTKAKTSPERRAVQTVLYELLATLTPLLVPVMPHMAEDIWLNIPEEHKPDFGLTEKPESILLSLWPQMSQEYLNNTVNEQMNQLLKIKETVNLALEKPRSDKLIGSSLEATILLHAKSEPIKALLKSVPSYELSTLFITSGVQVIDSPPASYMSCAVGLPGMETELNVFAEKAPGQKCIRCWKILTSVGENTQHLELCQPCVEAANV